MPRALTVNSAASVMIFMVNPDQLENLSAEVDLNNLRKNFSVISE